MKRPSCAAPTFDRTTFEATRTSEDFISPELATLIGQPPGRFAAVLMKELSTWSGVSGNYPSAAPVGPWAATPDPETAGGGMGRQAGVSGSGPEAPTVPVASLLMGTIADRVLFCDPARKRRA